MAGGINLETPFLASTGGRPPLRATSSATVFVNLLDLNDNDPTFQNLPFAAEIAEGLPAGSSVFQVSVPHICCALHWDLLLSLPLLLQSKLAIHALHALHSLHALHPLHPPSPSSLSSLFILSILSIL